MNLSNKDIPFFIAFADNQAMIDAQLFYDSEISFI